MKQLLLSVAFSLIGGTIMAQGLSVNVKKQSGGDFVLAENGSTCKIFVDKNEDLAVKKAASLFASDLKLVTGVNGNLTDRMDDAENVVIVGTIGNNKVIDRLIKNGKINVDKVKGGWEQYVIATVDNPQKGIKRALVVAGCDRRGAAYGLLSVSEAMGVSPWYWWTDMPVAHKNSLYVKSVNYSSAAPTVKFRGFFINDEDWGFTPWAKKNMDKDINDVGPNTYAKVCELLLRLKANMLAPAMHNCTGYFYKFPKNKLVADSFGIMITTSHCEPLLYNNATEWNHDRNGDWNYKTNRKGIMDVLDARVKEAAPFENLYTLALRGIHDGGMIGVPDNEKVQVLGDALNDERNIIAKYVKKPINTVPQIFVPYKEVLDVYEKGLKLPDDVTIVWPDDNFGYMKRLSNADEQKRSGHSGVYYHISYLGEPNDYLWINTTPPSLIYEELSKAYNTGADRYWLLNVGDIKPGELGIQLVMNMAWNIHAFDYDKVSNFNNNWLSSIYGQKYNADLKFIFDEYYRLAFSHKPEYMTWIWQWNTYFAQPNIQDTEYSFVNYDEAQTRLAQYDKIEKMARNIYNNLPESLKPSFFQIVYYPVCGASLKNKEMLYAQLNRMYAGQNRAITNTLADQVVAYHDSIADMNKTFNTQLGGKWDGYMTGQGFFPKSYLPPLKRISLPEEGSMGVSVDGEAQGQDFHALPVFNKITDRTYKICVYNKGKQPISWTAKSDSKFIRMSKTSGTTAVQDEILVSVDWKNAPKDVLAEGKITISSGNDRELVAVRLNNDADKSDIKGNCYVEDNGVVSINGGVFQGKKETANIKISTLPALGYEGSCAQLGVATAPKESGAYVEYNFFTIHAGDVQVKTYMLPFFAIDKLHGTRYGVQIDNGEISWNETAAKEYSDTWKRHVWGNRTINVSSLKIDKPGNHVLRIICDDPGAVVQKVTIDLGGEKPTYTGPKTTFYSKK